MFSDVYLFAADESVSFKRFFYNPEMPLDVGRLELRRGIPNEMFGRRKLLVMAVQRNEPNIMSCRNQLRRLFYPFALK